MNFNLEWLPDAEQELAAVWLNSSDRARVSAAATEIDFRLALDPEQGESRPNGRRILFCKPLGVLYRVSLKDQRVQVVLVDQPLVDQLRHSGKTVAVVDGRGQLLGHFVPAQDGGPKPNISEEELTRRESRGGGRPLVEILTDLEKRR